MAPSKITIRVNAFQNIESVPFYTVMTLHALKREIMEGRIFQHLFRYGEARLLVYRIDLVRKPLRAALLLRLLSHRTCYFEDVNGQRQAITFMVLVRLVWLLVRDYARKPAVLRHSRREVGQLMSSLSVRKREHKAFELSATPVYLRTDLVFGLQSGGAVGHIAGVLNHLDEFTGSPVFLTTARIPTVRDDIETHVIVPEDAYRDFAELPELYFNRVFEREAYERLRGKRLAFVYQRYSLNNYAGVKLARTSGIPFVLEYNGSEIWMGRYWWNPLKHEARAEQIELLNLTGADMIVVGSQPLKNELVTRAIDARKILVNPNGVDPERYHPGIDGSRIRDHYGVQKKIVVGFISTFGKWHGAEVLARAVKPVVRAGDTVHFLFIGDGQMMPEVKNIVDEDNVNQYVTFTGMVPQSEASGYLAACDIVTSPHVSNPDGTPFFGSPTKLFEYMAMEKGIVASDLDQIGEVLEHEENALLVSPGDPEALAHAILRLTGDAKMRERLGKNARERVVGRYTWEKNVKRMIDALVTVTRTHCA